VGGFKGWSIEGKRMDKTRMENVGSEGIQRTKVIEGMMKVMEGGGRALI